MYDAFDDPYSYPGTAVLRNRLDLRSVQELEEFEVEISLLRAEEPLPAGNLDATHYRNIHHHLFQDVYDWAGEYRTVRTAKGGNAFCYPEYIEDQMRRLFVQVSWASQPLDLSRREFVTLLAEFLGELNAIHPFREGNGRAQLAFAGLLGATFGHLFHFEHVEQQTFLDAMIASYSASLWTGCSA